MEDFRKYLDEQFEHAKQRAIDEELNEVKVSVTLTFEFTMKKPKEAHNE